MMGDVSVACAGCLRNALFLSTRAEQNRHFMQIICIVF